MNGINACENASKALRTLLKNSPRLQDLVTFTEYNGAHCFRLTFNRGPVEVQGVKLVGLSIAYSPDRCGNRGPEPPETIEIALINEKNRLCYIECLGYYDICSFSSYDEIVDEIVRLSQFDPQVEINKYSE